MLFRSQIAQRKAQYEMMSERELANEISRLEKQMMAEAKNLEFEKAAATRDQIAKIKELAFGALAKDSI